MRTVLFIILSSLIVALPCYPAGSYEECSYFLSKRLTPAQKEALAIVRKKLYSLKKIGTVPEKVELASKILDIRGVDHRVSVDGLELVIAPSDRSALNVYAKNLYDNLGKTKLKYDPRMTADSQGLFNTRTATVYVDENFIALPRRSSTLQHEVMHAAIHVDEVGGEVSLFYGDIWRADDSVKISESPMYEDYLSFDESMTYPFTLRAHLHADMAKYKTLRYDLLAYTKKSMKNAVQIADATALNAGRVLKILKQSPEKIRFKKEVMTANYNSTYEALMFQVSDEGVLIDLPFTDPEAIAQLKKTKDEARPYVLKRVRKQMMLLKRLSNDLLPDYLAYQAIIEKVNAEKRTFSDEEFQELLVYANSARKKARDANVEYRKYVEKLSSKNL